MGLLDDTVQSATGGPLKMARNLRGSVALVRLFSRRSGRILA